VAYLIRAAACFGASLDIIGALPQNRKRVQELSGTMLDYVGIKTYSSIEGYLESVKGLPLVAMEISPRSNNFFSFRFKNEGVINIFIGHETLGVPGPILERAGAILEIPLNGAGYCLNAAMTANIVLYEVAKQYASRT
jgi:tRNA(Leu) C34 or U34 (ribose-2'-O)-methylase TrmL